MGELAGTVVAVARDGEHNFSKEVHDAIDLLKGLGVAGDAHCGKTVNHRSRVTVDPSQPNLRQVHLIASELFADLRGEGFELAPADLGENITTSGIDLINLPRAAVLKLGKGAEVEITGLRNPCGQIEQFRTGLLQRVIEKKPDGAIVRKAGIMGIVKAGGKVRAGDKIVVVLPPEPHHKLERV